MVYFDTCYLFRLYASEPGWEAVRRMAGASQCVTSAWHARAELASVLHRKRGEHHPERQIELVRRQFAEDLAVGVVSLCPLTEAVLARVEAVFAAAPVTVFLRAADALHLACAAEHGFQEVYSNDHRFLDAAHLFGLKGVNVIE